MLTFNLRDYIYIYIYINNIYIFDMHLRPQRSRLSHRAGHGYDVRDVAVSADNSRFASAGGDRQLFLWDVSTGKTVRKFGGHDGVINSVCVAAFPHHMHRYTHKFVSALVMKGSHTLLLWLRIK